MSKDNFISDIKKIRADARRNLTAGAVTDNYELDRNKVIELLNASLATETICTLRYKKHHYKAAELGYSVAAAEFLEHSQQEQDHANQLAERIQQLGGEANLDPATLTARSHADYVDCDNVRDMVKENLVAERIAIDTYREMIKFIGNEDTTTRKMLEGILATEEEHADDLLDVAAEYSIDLKKAA